MEKDTLSTAVSEPVILRNGSQPAKEKRRLSLPEPASVSKRTGQASSETSQELQNKTFNTW